MKSTKEDIIKALKQFPEDKESFYIFNNIGLLPKPIELLLKYMREIYEPNQLRVYMEKKETAYEFPFLINKLIDAINPLSEWLDENRLNFAQGKLSDFTRELIDKRRKQIVNTENEILKIKHLCKELEEQIENIREKINALEKNEHRYNYLLQEADSLKKRKAELEDIKQQVEKGRLEQLEHDSKNLESQMSTIELEWKEKNRIKEDAQRRLDQRKNALQEIISGSAFIGDVNKLFDEIKEKCEKHNDRVLEEYGKSVKELEIRIDFNSRTSKGVLDTSMEEKLKKAKALIREVEQSIKARITKK